MKKAVILLPFVLALSSTPIVIFAEGCRKQTVKGNFVQATPVPNFDAGSK